MDQTILSGVGNVYRAEVLFRNRVDPHRPGNRLSRRSWLGIWSDLVALMPEGVRDNRIDTVRPGAHAGGDGPAPAPRRPRRRGLRLPPHRDALLGLRRQGADRAARRAEPLLVWPVSAPGLTYGLGRGSVALQPDGSIAAVRPGPDATSYLTGGPVRVWIGGTAVVWPELTVAADVDEVEFGGTAAEGLGLVVRHSFTADWGVRVALVNHTLEPLALTAELAWSPADPAPAWVLAAGATGAYAIPGPDGRGPLLGGELVLGTCDVVTGTGIGLGRLELGPLERWVVQWRWAWYANARAFSRNRFLAVPRDLVLSENESARIVADEDTAVVAPGADTARRGPHLELTASGGQRVSVEVRSRRGTTAYDLEWVEPLDDALVEVGDGLLDGPRTRAGVVVLPDVDAALVLQHLLVGGRTGSPDLADDALGLFLTRAVEAPTGDGRGVSLLCGEFDRTGDPDLLEQATAHLLALDRPVPGLGLAAAQVCVARLSQGWPLDPVLTHLGGWWGRPATTGWTASRPTWSSGSRRRRGRRTTIPTRPAGWTTGSAGSAPRWARGCGGGRCGRCRSTGRPISRWCSGCCPRASGRGSGRSGAYRRTTWPATPRPRCSPDWRARLRARRTAG